jgi:hypothetical protein
MPQQHEWQSRIKAVEREYRAMRQAADTFLESIQRDVTILQSQLRPRDIETASDNLEATYFVRLFAEFESGARQYWNSVRATSPATGQLLNRLADRRRIPDLVRDRAHVVRSFRNALVHERKDVVEKGSERSILNSSDHFIHPLYPVTRHSNPMRPPPPVTGPGKNGTQDGNQRALRCKGGKLQIENCRLPIVN